MYHEMKLCCFSTLHMYGEEELLFQPILQREGIVSSILKRNKTGRVTKNTPSQKALIENAVQLVREGVSINQAAKRTNTPISTVRYHYVKTRSKQLPLEIYEYTRTLDHLFEPTMEEIQHAELWQQRKAAMPRPKRKHVRFTEEQRNAAVERVRQGERIQKVANEIGAIDVSVWQWCKKRGVLSSCAAKANKKKNGITPEIEGRIRTFLQQYPHTSRTQIYAAFGEVVTEPAMRHYLDTHPELHTPPKNWMKRIVPVNREDSNTIQKKRGRPRKNKKKT